MRLRGDAVEFVTRNPFAGDLKTPAYRAMSPFGKMPVPVPVPVLELDDGAAIFESTSILEHLEARGPRRLIPDAHASAAAAMPFVEATEPSRGG